jgi:hypothetical protein
VKAGPRCRAKPEGVKAEEGIGFRCGITPSSEQRIPVWSKALKAGRVELAPAGQLGGRRSALTTRGHGLATSQVWLNRRENPWNVNPARGSGMKQAHEQREE